jgi:hypothetical protein
MRATPPGCRLLLASTAAAALLAGAEAFAEQASEPAPWRSARLAPPYAHALEPAVLTEGWTDLMEHAARRYRPRAWHTGGDDDPAPLPSAHVAFAPAFAGAKLWAAIRARGKRLCALRWVSFSLSEAAAVATTTLRAGAGPRWASDVLGGLAVGHVSGLGLALARPVIKRMKLGVVQVSAKGVSWSGAF